MGEVLLPRSSPPPPGPPLPRLPWHHSQSILTPPSSVPAAWAPASCVFLGMLQNSAETKEIPLEFAGRALTRQSTRAADLDSIPFQPEDYNFAGKEGVASELHLTRAIPRLLSGISVKFLKLPGKPALSWEADIPGGLRVQEAPAARFLFKAWDWVREAFCDGPRLSWSSQPFTAAGFKAGERAKSEPPV